jgi:hypothetical protein
LFSSGLGRFLRGTSGSSKTRARKISSSVGCAEKTGIAGGGVTFGTVRLALGGGAGVFLSAGDAEMFRMDNRI